MGRLALSRAAASARLLIVHPLTGEVLPDELDVLVAQEVIVDGWLRGLRAHYSFRRLLRERIAELRGEAVLPRRAYRTDKQQRVAECPRCGGKDGKHFVGMGEDPSHAEVTGEVHRPRPRHEEAA